jgi:hypothetical protein
MMALRSRGVLMRSRASAGRSQGSTNGVQAITEHWGESFEWEKAWKLSRAAESMTLGM